MHAQHEWLRLVATRLTLICVTAFGTICLNAPVALSQETQAGAVVKVAGMKLDDRKRVAVPNAAAQKEAMELVKEVFADDCQEHRIGWQVLQPEVPAHRARAGSEESHG